jgi:hypothetical protein
MDDYPRLVQLTGCEAPGMESDSSSANVDRFVGYRTKGTSELMMATCEVEDVKVCGFEEACGSA